MKRLRDQAKLLTEENDEDIMKIDRLQLINASARHELLSANQQLLDFQLNRFVNRHHRQRTLRKAVSDKHPDMITAATNYKPLATS